MQATLIPVTVSGKNINVTPALEEHAERKVLKALRMFEDHPTVRADVVLHTEKQGHKAEVTVVVGGYFLRGECLSSDMYHSINEAVARVEGQLRKFKAKLNRKLHAEAREIETPWEAPLSERAEDPVVVKRKQFALKPMDTDEAVLQMELLGHDFFIFTRADTFAVNVLYRRKNGDYGLIEPVVG